MTVGFCLLGFNFIRESEIKDTVSQVVLPLMFPKTILLLLLLKMTLCNLDAKPLKYSSVQQKNIKKVL